MKDLTFKIFKETDSYVIGAFKEIARLYKQNPPSEIYIEVIAGINNRITCNINNIDENEILNKLLAHEGDFLSLLRLDIQSIKCKVAIKRGQTCDDVTLSVPEDIDLVLLPDLITSINTKFRTYGRSESTDKMLGDELAEFYRKREHTLLRLEELSQKLIEQNEDYRKQIDADLIIIKDELQKKYEQDKDILFNEYKGKDDSLKMREEEFNQRLKSLDDRDSKHARRQLRMDLKKEFARRSTEFSLTKGTSRKRNIIHILFTILLLFFISMIWSTFDAMNQILSLNPKEIVPPLYLIFRLSLSSLGFVATIIFYIRWNDNWFRQHADEEFSLKRLELDFDRASWVVEMALEWKEEKGSEIPNELINRLTDGLFINKTNDEIPKHPSQDLADALISASSGLTLKIPGLGEATIDRRGIKKFIKSSLDINQCDVGLKNN